MSANNEEIKILMIIFWYFFHLRYAFSFVCIAINTYKTLYNTSIKTGCEVSKVHQQQQRVSTQVSKTVTIIWIILETITNCYSIILRIVLEKMMPSYTRGKTWRTMAKRNSRFLLRIVKQLLFSKRRKIGYF